MGVEPMSENQEEKTSTSLVGLVSSATDMESQLPSIT